MQITLNQDELEKAVREHIANAGISGSIGEVSFTTTRNPVGILTAITIGESSPISPSMQTKESKPNVVAPVEVPEVPSKTGADEPQEEAKKPTELPPETAPGSKKSLFGKKASTG